MKAAIYRKYGPPEVLQIEEIPKPFPQNNEVLIKILATTVSSGDARMRSFNVPPLPWLPFRIIMGLTGPKNQILGSSLSGIIEAVGKGVTRYIPGDEVFGSSYIKQGCYSEYICLPDDAILTIKPYS
ncbi:MAG: alcohol dehydrogenase catalytic domain-containing protein, partial [Saprospiraceae bacterium]|nr:alcohol dehydrogenase catalytic domain-containing protein [Saprospiraceae bacterium]